MIVFIGDVHGKINRLRRLVHKYLDEPKEETHVFQLGDMGLGFTGVWLYPLPENFKWIRGNHDNPAACYANSNYLGDYGILKVQGYKIFYLAGAYSIDSNRRIPGISWWEDEELSWSELDKAYELYIKEKPDLVISHECPQDVGLRMLAMLHGSYYAAKQECCHSRTASALQRMFDAHQPKDWVFGHYHLNQHFSINGTQFRCCAELETYILPSKSPLSSEVNDAASASITVTEE